MSTSNTAREYFNKTRALPRPPPTTDFPRGDHLRRLLSTSNSFSNATAHPLEKHKLFQSICKDDFGLWEWELSCGFSVLLHGLGSKVLLLERFAEWYGKRHRGGAVVIGIHSYLDGFDFQSHVLGPMMEYWLGWGEGRIKMEKKKTLWELCRALGEQKPGRKVLLVWNSVDAGSVNKGQVQKALAVLAASSQVYLVASCDHVNTQAMWTQEDWDMFKFATHDATTYLRYTIETDGFTRPSLMSETKATTTSAAGIGYILKSLTLNHVSILKDMARRQLDEDSRGIEFQELLQRCSNKLWVANESRLRAYLQEFQDHDLVVCKRGKDGVERLVIKATKQDMENQILGFGE